MFEQSTFVIFKPDAVRRRLVGRILQRFEDKGLAIERLQMRNLLRSDLADHYQSHSDKPFYAGLISSMTSGECVIAVLRGHLAISVVKNLVGGTDGSKAAPGTIRGDFASGAPIVENLIHASDTESSAAREIRIFFRVRM